MDRLRGYNDLLECPYNKAHQILPEAMQKHLFKCRRNYPNSGFKTCPFNETHDVPGKELKIHQQTCPDRFAYDTYKYKLVTEGESAKVSHNDPEPIGATAATLAKLADEENWDDMNEKPYNPERYCIENKILRKATLKTPSQKKAFYEQERMRLKQFKDD